MAKDVKVGSYSGLEDGSKTASNYSKSLEELIKEADTEIDKLKDASVFAGPASNQCVNAYNAVKSAVLSSSSDFSKLANDVAANNANYNMADQAAENTIDSIKNE